MNDQEQGYVELVGENPDTVAHVIHFLYSGDYHAFDEPCTERTHNMKHNTYQHPTKLNSDRAIELWESSEDIDVLLGRHAFKALQVSADIYRCADKLCIQPLQYLSATRIMDIMHDIQEWRCFAAAVELVFQTTTNEDLLLRAAVVALCTYNHRVVTRFPALEAIIDWHEGGNWQIACGVARSYMQHHKEQLKVCVLEAAGLSMKCRSCGAIYDGTNITISDTYLTHEDAALVYDIQIGCCIGCNPPTTLTFELV